MQFVKSAFFVVGAIVICGYLMNMFINPGDALPRNHRMGEWRESKVRPACYSAVDDLNDSQLPKYPSASKVDFGDFSRMVQLTAALNCYVVTERQAICEPNNRAWVVDYIGKYYGKMDDILNAAARGGETEVRLVKEALSSDRNKAIAFAIEANLREGRLAKSDFGWSAPRALKPLLEKYAAAPDKCPPIRSETKKI